MICSGCKTDNGVSNAGNVGEMQNQTGWAAFFSWTGPLEWVCPMCQPKVRQAMQDLVAAMGGPEKVADLYLRGLVKWATTEPKSEGSTPTPAKET